MADDVTDDHDFADDNTVDHDLANDITDDLNSKVRRESTVSQSVSQSGGCSNCRPLSPPPPPPPPPTLAQVHKEPIKQKQKLHPPSSTLAKVHDNHFWFSDAALLGLFALLLLFLDIIRISVSLLLRHPNQN